MLLIPVNEAVDAQAIVALVREVVADRIGYKLLGPEDTAPKRLITFQPLNLTPALVGRSD